MRHIGVIDVGANDCVTELGGCTNSTADAVRIRNPFARKVRRVIEFIGPFEEQTRTFRGVYRDKISGLNPESSGGTLTLQGDFNLGQMNDEAAFDGAAWNRPLLSAATAGTTVSFPLRTAALTAVQRDIDLYCVGDGKNYFDDALTYKALVADLATSGNTVLRTPVTFNGEVGKALAALKPTSGSNGQISFYDLLRNQLRFCDDAASAPPADSCMSKKALRCSLALFRKATLSLPTWVESWDPKPAPLGDSPTHALFCAEESGDPAAMGVDCTLDRSSSNPRLATLLEHNRFYKELTQTLGFSAGAAASEAAMLLYKNAAGLPLGSVPGVTLDSVFARKKYQLRQAFNAYEDARNQLLPPAPAYILYEWPMRSFVGHGQSWMAQMRGLMNSRLEALEEYLDLARRQQRVETEQLSLFMHHVGQQEFLTQVYLMNLQAQWEGTQYQHSPAIQDSLDRVTALLAKSDITRNPFGLEANRVYFENTDPNVTNWEYYRNAAQQKLNAATNTIKGPGGALEVLRASLANKNALESALSNSRFTFDAILDNLCGPQVTAGESLPAACAVDAAKRLEEAACFGPDCKAAWSCEDQQCKRVIQTFEAGLQSLQAGNQACVVSNPSITVPYEGGRRPCVRGQVGELLQEKVLLELQRKQAGAELATLVSDIRAGLEYVRKVVAFNAMDGLATLVTTASLAAGDVGASAVSIEAAKAKAESEYCVAGTANDCPTKKPAMLLLKGELTAMATKAAAAQAGLEEARVAIQAYMLGVQTAKELARETYALETKIGQAELTVHKVAILTQQTFNLDMRIDDLIQQANVASSRRSEDVNDVIAAVSGQNLGEAITLNAQVAQSNRLMREALVDAYKMTVAYLHRSNSKTKWEPLVDGIYTAVTLGDLQEQIDKISLAASRCTESDCDGPRNSELRWFSMRDNLFPTLTDIVAADTGATLTKGEQFHNILASSAYRRRRMVGGNMLDVIEIPFATRALAETGQAGFTVNSCNDVIVPFKLGQADAGTLVVNFLLSRPPPSGDAPEYVLVRGSTDQMLGCTKTSPPTGGPAYFPISSFLVGPPGGYAERMAGSNGSGEAFFTQSGSWKACMNARRDEQELFNKGCFKTFARERSYGSLEWTLILPIVPATSTSPGKNRWLYGGNTVVNDIEIGLRVSAATRSN
ncbi:MAG: hypothetical protein MUF54_12800 [Polyangiaceae bacterium]|nr:hypothetical protein [Polyangiaceae bacterium]